MWRDEGGALTVEEEIEKAFRAALDSGDTLDEAADRATKGLGILVKQGGSLNLSFVAHVAPIVHRIRTKLEKELA